MTIEVGKLDKDARETVSHLIEYYEDGCFTKEERIMLSGLALKARLRYQLNKYTEKEAKGDLNEVRD